MKRNILYFFLIGLLWSCAKTETPKVATISGKILDSGISSVKFSSLNTNPITPLKWDDYEAPVNEQGEFSIEIPLEHLCQGQIKAGRFYHNIALMPGDRFSAVIEADTILYSGGAGASRNNFLYQTEKERVWISSFYRINRKRTMSPEQYLEAVNNLAQKRDQFLASSTDDLEPEFRKNYLSDTQLTKQVLLFRFADRYARTNKIPIDSLELPADYLRTFNLSGIVNDDYLSSDQYLRALNSIFNKTQHQLSLQRLREPTNHDKRATYQDISSEIAQELLRDSLTGKTREYYAAYVICDNFRHHGLDSTLYKSFLALNPDDISSSTVQSAIDRYEEKQALIGQPLHPSFVNTMVEDSTGAQFSFADMLDRYKGQIVYLDIWSLNCGPCRSAMPASQELHKHVEDLPIAFVYLAQDRPKEDVWDQIFQVSLGRENRYRMVDHTWGSSPMLQFLEINWVPCYMLFDKEGRLIDYQASRPMIMRNGVIPIEKRLRELAANS